MAEVAPAILNGEGETNSEKNVDSKEEDELLGNEKMAEDDASGDGDQEFLAMDTSVDSNQLQIDAEQPEVDSQDDDDIKQEVEDNIADLEDVIDEENEEGEGLNSAVPKNEPYDDEDDGNLESNMSESAEDPESLLISCGGGDASSPVQNGENDLDKADLKDSCPTSPSEAFSVNDGNVIAKSLETQIKTLTHMLMLKEQEWNGILRLKKHFEFALEHVKVTQRLGKVPETMNQPMTTEEVRSCMELIVSKADNMKMAERQMRESIENTEAENESLQAIFPFTNEDSVKEDSGQVSKESFTASAALQKLCERKRKAMEELLPSRASRLRTGDATVLTATQSQSRVIGNGRKGAIVDVQSIIQSHRNSTITKSSGERQRRTKPSYDQMISMPPERKFVKTLEDLMTLVKSKQEQDSISFSNKHFSITSVATAATSQAKPVLPKSKNGRPARPTVNNSLLATPSSSSSGTLAKMLSPSTHSNVGGSVPSTQKFGGKLANADSNLSLATLLATSKVETKGNISKAKKDRVVRDEESSHVPSQQEAVPICQGCNLSRAQFVCAGCANQWYCSRECQVAAWDEHSEICSG